MVLRFLDGEAADLDGDEVGGLEAFLDFDFDGEERLLLLFDVIILLLFPKIQVLFGLSF